MLKKISVLEKLRLKYQPGLPQILAEENFHPVHEKKKSAAESAEEIRKLFPHSFDMPVVWFKKGRAKGKQETGPLTVGVVLSGGQSPGGHNVVAGILDALLKVDKNSRLLGFLDGPIGVIKGRYRELTPEIVESFRNTGGFDMIGSGRDKIEKPEDLKQCGQNLENLGVNTLVIVGGDDSNTNAAVLAEYFLAKGDKIQVIGVPKTIDGDMKNEWIEASFGFDSAAKTYAELTGNICRDAMSARKYWHFIRLMGRSASHLTLEVALQTQPNLAVISEEVTAKKMTLNDVVGQFVDVIVRRAAAGKNYGVAVIPEGLLEFLGDMKALIRELNAVLKTEEEYLNSLKDHTERFQYLSTKLTPESAKAYASLPVEIQEILLKRDKHGNVPLSQIETEKLIIDLVGDQLRLMTSHGQFKGKFAPLNHFFGYEGRSLPPSNFDANYAYSLGYAAVQLIRAGLTGYTVAAKDLVHQPAEWQMGGVPVTSMLTIEMRKGEPKPVIKKTLVDLNGSPFKTFAGARDSWVIDDAYVFPGPIQYFGDSEVTDTKTMTMTLEHSGKK